MKSYLYIYTMKKTQHQYKETLLSIIDEANFTVDFLTNESSILVRYKYGGYLLEFSVGYDERFYNIVESNYDAPDEFDVDYEVIDITDFTIYTNNNILELDEDIYSEIEEQIEIKIKTKYNK